MSDESGSNDSPGKKTWWWQRTRETSYGLLAILFFVILFLTVLAWTVMRHQSFSLEAPDSNATTFTEQIPSVASLSQGALVDGNAVEIGINGTLFDRLLDDISRAEESIHLETFVWWDGDVTLSLANALAEKARNGVEVRVTVDASGGSKMTAEVKDLLQSYGAQLQWFRPFRLGNLGRLNYRTHRKIVVIDGRIAYLFGHGIAEEWTGDAERRDRYRDTWARIEGPVVNQIQGVFFENWVEEKRELPAGTRYFPEIEPAGNITTHLAWIQPIGDVSAVETLFYAAIAAAREEVIIQNPYFIVEDQGVELFRRAIARGVDVKVMLPSVEATDNALVQHASHRRFEELLEIGVEIWEYDKTLLHQKVMVVDGVWSSIGSTNFDDRSFELNDEIQIGIVSPIIAAELLAHFREDLEHSTRIELAEFRERSLWHKLKDWTAYAFNEQL